MTSHARRALLARRVLVGVAIAAGVAVLGSLALRARNPSAGATGGQPGQRAPLFTSTDLSGRPVDLLGYRGHRVVLNFWSSSCIPCRAEFPVLAQLLHRHPDVVVLGVVFDDFDRSARDFMRAHGATWPGVRDPKSQIAHAYGVYPKPGIPVSILVDAAGRVRARQYGGLLDQAAADAFLGHAPTT